MLFRSRLSGSLRYHEDRLTLGHPVTISPVAAAVRAVTSSPAAPRPAAPSTAIPSASGPLPATIAEAQAQARALIAAGKRTSQQAAFAAVPESAGGGDKGRLSLLRWQNYVRVLRAS